jgi:signal transduction histidine kinase
LGLAISKGIVEAHGGTMWVDKEYLGGARFIFTLPVKEESI